MPCRRDWHRRRGGSGTCQRLPPDSGWACQADVPLSCCKGPGCARNQPADPAPGAHRNGGPPKPALLGLECLPLRAGAARVLVHRDGHAHVEGPVLPARAALLRCLHGLPVRCSPQGLVMASPCPSAWMLSRVSGPADAPRLGVGPIEGAGTASTARLRASLSCAGRNRQDSARPQLGTALSPLRTPLDVVLMPCQCSRENSSSCAARPSRQPQTARPGIVDCGVVAWRSATAC